MNDYYNFLAFNLNEVTTEFEHPSQAAHEMCLLLSVDKTGIPETFYRMYISAVDLPEELIINASAFFIGSKFLKVICDCDSSDKTFCEIYNIQENAFYEMGYDEFLDQTERWKSMMSSLNNLRKEIVL